MRILIINGPNLNLLGTREPEVYGTDTYADLDTFLRAEAKELNIDITIRQSNYEGAILDLMHHAASERYEGIILNAAAYSHYSYAIRDGIKAISIPVVNVHLTDPASRPEAFRHTDVIKPVCVATIKGKGFVGYVDALRLLTKEVIR